MNKKLLILALETVQKTFINYFHRFCELIANRSPKHSEQLRCDDAWHTQLQRIITKDGIIIFMECNSLSHPDKEKIAVLAVRAKYDDIKILLLSVLKILTNIIQHEKTS